MTPEDRWLRGKKFTFEIRGWRIKPDHECWALQRRIPPHTEKTTASGEVIHCLDRARWETEKYPSSIERAIELLFEQLVKEQPGAVDDPADLLEAVRAVADSITAALREAVREHLDEPD